MTEKTVPEVNTLVYYAGMANRFVEVCPNMILPKSKLRAALYDLGTKVFSYFFRSDTYAYFSVWERNLAGEILYDETLHGQVM